MAYARCFWFVIIACASFSLCPCECGVPFVDCFSLPPEVTNVRIDEAGVKWFGGHDCGSYHSYLPFLLRYDGLGVDRYEVRDWWPTSVEHVDDLELAGDGRPWLASRSEVYYLEGTELISLRAPNNFDLFGHADLTWWRAFEFDREGNMWVGWSQWPRGEIGRYVFHENWRDGTGALHYGNWAADGQGANFGDFALAPDGTLWFTADNELYRVEFDGEIAAFDKVDTGVDDPYLEIAGFDISLEGHFWLLYCGNGQPSARPFIQHSIYCLNWEHLDLPSALTSPAEEVFLTDVLAGAGHSPCFAARFSGPSGAGAGLLWRENDTWRWIPLGQISPCDLALDETTGDVWSVWSEGVYVLRGGPDVWPPVYIEVRPVHDPLQPEETAFIMGDAWFQKDLRLDLYVAVEDADGNLLFAPHFTQEMRPMAQSFDVAIGTVVENYPLLELDLTGVPAGTYRWHAACTHAGTIDFASNIASCEWEFE